MTRKQTAAQYSACAALQELNALAHRRDLADAFQETDKRIVEHQHLESQASDAFGWLDNVFATTRLSLDQLQLASANLQIRDAALRKGYQALETAQLTEANTLHDWNRAAQTAEWFAGRERAMLRKAESKQENLTIERVNSLKLSLSREYKK